MPDSRERPLSILEVTHAGDGAGSTFVIQALSETLARRGHRVLVGCRPESLLAQRARAAGLVVVPLDFHRLGPLAEQLAALFARERVDVVNSHETRDRRALTWLRWRGRLRPGFVVTRHTMPLTSSVELLAIGMTADATIAVSHAVARALRRRLYPKARLRVVPNGIDPAKVEAVARCSGGAPTAALGEPDGRPLIVILARRKDQHVVLRGLELVRPPVVVACVGIEPDRELLSIPIPPRHRVVYVPFTDQPLAFYRRATVAALPSRIEGLSIALLEAMALGLPVVASRAGGNPDLIVSGETGILVSPLDSRAWAVALERVLNDPDFAGRLARAGRDLVRREHSLEGAIDRTEAVYWEAVERRRSVSPSR